MATATPGELADALAQPAQAGKLVADPREPAVEIADGSQGLDGLGQLLGLEHRADLGAADVRADVVQAAEGRRRARADRLDHLGRQ